MENIIAFIFRIIAHFCNFRSPPGPRLHRWLLCEGRNGEMAGLPRRHHPCLPALFARPPTVQHISQARILGYNVANHLSSRHSDCFTPMSFDPIAHFYDLDDGRLSADIPLYLGFAGKTGGPILDLGVGSGRLALPLARAGYQVFGIDISAEMLAIGRERIMRAGLREHIHLIQADFSQPLLDAGGFALAFCSFNAFLHLIESQEQLQALTSWRRALKPGGLLVIDVENPQLEALAELSEQLELEEVLMMPEPGRAVRKYTAAWADLPDQVLYLRRAYEMDDGRWETSFQVRILFQRELALLLSCAGFDNLRFYGDYDLTPWEPDSPRLIAVAAKESQSAHNDGRS